MDVPRKIIVHSVSGSSADLKRLVGEWIAEGVKYVGVFGVGSSRIEELIDEICVGDGDSPYFMLTASHGQDETLQDAMDLASILSEDFPGQVHVVEL